MANKVITDGAALRRFPKVELHRHLEGTFALPTLHRIALRNGLPYPEDFARFQKEVQFPRDAEPDFLLFLSKFKNDWYRSHQDIRDIVRDSVLSFAEDGLFFIELRFSPEHFAFHNNFDRLEVTKLIVDAANEAAAETGVLIRYLITFNRAKQNQYEMISLYRELRGLQIPEIVGIDLAGDETNFPPQQFTEFFQVVRDDGVYGATIHAGEVSPAQQVWDAIELLHAARIGHGTSTIDDPLLQKRLIEEGVVLEQCITSNYQTGSWADEKNHPLGRLFRAGVPVTINSDDPTIQDTDLTDDYVKACTYFDLTVDDLVTLNMNALDGTFLPDTEKSELKQRYLRAVTAFRTAHNL
ncbi:adenosine deaminase [Alkalispirochaeta sphaeroplastigenens]|uniref:adenosine deaminase n=1 Tax=Alkalispirochaeta sphaeroplastigenens TaxID=1187066 RepID=A0A2S4K0S1_9SPIO|nr:MULTISPECIES: adenosine deaminase [Alkalispirochaeta]POR05372.1 adenosine deaminase [Alkalispirochaeta sphaeroplastigenens]